MFVINRLTLDGERAIIEERMGRSSRKTAHRIGTYSHICTYHRSASSMNDCYCPIPFPSHGTLVEFVVFCVCLDVRPQLMLCCCRPRPHKDDVLSLDFEVIKFLGEIIIVIDLFLHSVIISFPVSDPTHRFLLL